MSIPDRVYIREVGPREGFQIHPTVVSTEDKLRLISALSLTGISHIEVTAMVKADRVPQHADAEAVIAGLPMKSDVSYTALYLNQKGFQRLNEFPQIHRDAWISMAVCEEFLKKNSNATLATLSTEIPSWISLFGDKLSLEIRLMVSTAFGSSAAGIFPPEFSGAAISRIAKAVSDAKGRVVEVCLADTIGIGTPEQVRSLVRLVRAAIPGVDVSLHLHDTRGQGVANAYAGLLEGVTVFEASVGGIGGCPFTKGASGNVATEELLYLFEGLGIKTGVSLQKYILAGHVAQQVLAVPLPSRMFKAAPVGG